MEKIRENRLRRNLYRLGFQLMKSRVSPRGYMILSAKENTVIAGNQNGIPFTLVMDDVEAFIKEQENTK